MQKIHIYRTIPIKADSRILRYEFVFKDSQKIYHTWEDQKSKVVLDNHKSFVFNKGGNKIVKLVKFIIFQFWTFKTFITSTKNSVHLFMDIDTCLLVSPFFNFRKTILDIVDPISQTKFLRFSKTHKFIDKIELNIARKADLIIFPHEIRKDYYEFHGNFDYSIIENVPQFKKTPSIVQRSNKVKTIGYFGTLDKNTRGLEYLLSLAINNPHTIKVIFGGGGALKQEIENAASLHTNIKFIGRYKHDELPFLTIKLDYYWSYYSPNIKLHEYAIPNKFYEHLQLDLPIIASRIIPQSKFIEKNNTGIIVDDLLQEQQDDLIKRLYEFKFESGVIYNLWNEKYKGYYNKIIIR